MTWSELLFNGVCRWKGKKRRKWLKGEGRSAHPVCAYVKTDPRGVGINHATPLPLEFRDVPRLTSPRMLNCARISQTSKARIKCIRGYMINTARLCKKKTHTHRNAFKVSCFLLPLVCLCIRTDQCNRSKRTCLHSNCYWTGRLSFQKIVHIIRCSLLIILHSIKSFSKSATWMLDILETLLADRCPIKQFTERNTIKYISGSFDEFFSRTSIAAIHESHYKQLSGELR